jgi:hypothetical protein
VQVWFFLTDDVPELQIKLSWLKLKYLEQLARELKTPITNSWVIKIQAVTGMYYQRINHAMGYRALNPVLDTVASKMSEPSRTRIKEYRQWNDANGITNLFNDYCEDIVRNVRSDLYTSAEKRHESDYRSRVLEIYNISGVWHKSIPITPVSPDLLPAT